MQTTNESIGLSDREREFGAILKAYNEVTERLKVAHDRLNDEVGRLRGELERKNAELRRHDRLAALGEMAAGLAHEVRNPLGGIALYASLLERELSDGSPSHVAAARITQSVRSLDRLVSEILDFAQEDRLDRRVCVLGEILSDLQGTIEHWTVETRADCVFESSAREVRLDCDPDRLRQVLLNLLINGLQAAGAGGHVVLRAERTPSSNETDALVRIEVTDDGPGIPKEQLERIFNPFYTTKATGTGLGLAIVHRIMEAHGGTVRVMNRAEGGARFVLDWPPEKKEC